jgi:hypothetical protein
MSETGIHKGVAGCEKRRSGISSCEFDGLGSGQIDSMPERTSLIWASIRELSYHPGDQKLQVKRMSKLAPLNELTYTL